MQCCAGLCSGAVLCLYCHIPIAGFEVLPEHPTHTHPTHTPNTHTQHTHTHTHAHNTHTHTTHTHKTHTGVDGVDSSVTFEPVGSDNDAAIVARARAGVQVRVRGEGEEVECEG